MSALARLCVLQGHKVFGYDRVHSTVTNELEKEGIAIIYDESLEVLPEEVLNKRTQIIYTAAIPPKHKQLDYFITNGFTVKKRALFMAELCADKTTLAVAGTHGKTTTSYMLCHIFLKQDRDIGYLVGGVSSSTGKSACLGSDNVFIVEADEYDSAFFDKRSKFIHYKTNTLVINNIEFDHADIFRDLDDIKKQFHHLIKTIPGSGNIIFY